MQISLDVDILVSQLVWSSNEPTINDLFKTEKFEINQLKISKSKVLSDFALES